MSLHIDTREKLRKLVGPKALEYQIRSQLGYEGVIKYYDHHASHPASSFYFSGYEEAVILTVDGVGEWATTTVGKMEKGGV